MVFMSLFLFSLCLLLVHGYPLNHESIKHLLGGVPPGFARVGIRQDSLSLTECLSSDIDFKLKIYYFFLQIIIK